MFIRFACPQCKKGLKVPASFAGKRVKCAACQKPIQVPAAPPPAATPAHAEELAAQVFGDGPKPVEEKAPEGAPIKFKCYYCDDDITMPADLAGKQVPCPSCRRIVKVPLQVKQEKKDWRDVTRTGPSAAKENIMPAPEGVWSASAKSRVSDEALMEADVLVEEVEPLSRQEKVRRAIMYTGAAIVTIGVGIGAWKMWSANAQEGTFRKALAFVDKDNEAKLAPEIATEVHRLAGEYHLRAGGALDKANDEFRKARGSLARARPGTMERDAELIDLALSQADLGGSKAQTKDHARLKWDDAQNELRQTLQKLSTPEARVEALRLLTRKFVARAQESEESKNDVQRRPDVIARLISGSAQETPELLAAVGLELLKADPEHAKALAQEALKPYAAAAPTKGPDGKEVPAQKPPPAASLVALLLAMNETGAANAVVEPPAPNAPSAVGEARLGHAVGLAHQGNWTHAMALCLIPGDPNQRFQALAAVAEVALDTSPEEAKKFVSAALDLSTREQLGNIPWAARQLAGVAVKVGMGDKLPPFFERLPAGVKSEAQLAALRSRLDKNAPADMDALNAEAAKKGQAYPRILSFLARHNAAHGSASDVQKAAAGWEPEGLRAPGFIGAALGLQDATLGSQQVAQKK